MIRLLLTVCAVLFALLFPSLARDWQAFGFLAIVATVGMAHGSLDHLVENSRNGRMQLQELVRFYGYYLMAAAAVGLLWWFNSSVGLVLFLLTSAYHFGQSELHDTGDQTWVIRLMRVTWGSALLVIPAVFHAHSFSSDLSSIGVHLAANDLQLIGQITLGLSGLLYLCGLLIGAYDRLMAMQAGLAWLAYALIFVLTPPLWGIALYFGIWHSWPALETLAKELELSNFQSWFRALAPNYLASLIAMLIWIALGWKQGVPVLVTGTLILLSALTVPHIYVFERIYRD